MGFEGFAGSMPAGTILMVAADRRYQKQLGPHCEVLFGRGGDNVHLAVGIDDPYVSRRQGLLLCDGHQWRLRNIGKLPIRLVDETMVLTGHELPLKAGCTPLLVGAPAHRVHLVEVHVSGKWTPRSAAVVVDAVRERLSIGIGPAGAVEGSVLNHQLIRSLLHNTALLPSDLHLLEHETLPAHEPQPDRDSRADVQRE